jgi:porphobilinogen synthase
MTRVRRSEGLRRLAEETSVSAGKLIVPIFVVQGRGVREAIKSMPGVERISVDVLRKRAKTLKSGAVMIFGVPDEKAKDDVASAAFADDGIVPLAV